MIKISRKPSALTVSLLSYHTVSSLCKGLVNLSLYPHWTIKNAQEMCREGRRKKGVNEEGKERGRPCSAGRRVPKAKAVEDGRCP